MHKTLRIFPASFVLYEIKTVYLQLKKGEMKTIKHITTLLLLLATSLSAEAQVKVKLDNYVAKSGTVSISSSVLESTHNGAYVIYQVSVSESGVYDAYTLFGTKKDGSSLSVDMDVNVETLKDRPVENSLTKRTSNPNNWAAKDRYTFGPFRLKAGNTYYLRINFLQSTSGSWVGNVHELGLSWTADQEIRDVVDVDIEQEGGYLLYSIDCNEKSSIYPFWRGWAWEPNYIEFKGNCYLEFYYNYEALKADNRRMRRGAEVTCDYKATRDGWYGFRILLPDEEVFPKNLDGTIIAQMFNNGDRNSWAGHLSISQDQLQVSYRHALVDPEKGTVGTVEWGRWIPVVMYFKVGRNNKGRIKVWMGDDMQEDNPTYDSGNVNFGFGEWTDDNTLNGEVTANNEVPDYIGCKFGLYVSCPHDLTIRYADIKALVGNPDGAFSIVKPTVDTTDGIQLMENGKKKTVNPGYYDLSGRKVINRETTKGVYILNGKKVIR